MSGTGGFKLIRSNNIVHFVCAHVCTGVYTYYKPLHCLTTQGPSCLRCQWQFKWCYINTQLVSNGVLLYKVWTIKPFVQKHFFMKAFSKLMQLHRNNSQLAVWKWHFWGGEGGFSWFRLKTCLEVLFCSLCWTPWAECHKPNWLEK